MRLSDKVEALQGPDREVELAIWAAIDPVSAKSAASEGKQPLPWLYCYTASLDAAMMLVPEGWQFCVTNGNGTWVRMSEAHPTIHGSNRHPAIALTAAALRARGL